MPDAFAYKDAEIMLTVVKCGCGNPDSHNGSPNCRCGIKVPHAAIGPAHLCPEPRSENDLGTVS